MPVENLARSRVVTADTDETVAELASMMDDEHVGSVVIADGDEPVGIVTDRDLATRVLGNGSNPDETTAEDVMSEELTMVSESDGFYTAAERMAEEGVRRLPVTDGDGQLSGIITADDFTELLADEQAQLSSIIQAQRPAYD
ncbi:signal transduction protein with CBS domains [Halovivax asiaticus JCM 14624]|uniref:Signal transduction protein with CBS domains n=1 Tax=Halovivax asiaticus JCM 14624 TaxID=1227490 RepID=M0BTH6_9EURY|nr:CBS domain-containing protein [Halovivax asiaticus]ELZ14336.1 signal transduction protein with CBS domains [Halovivax asiaticus JCM 14624]